MTTACSTTAEAASFAKRLEDRRAKLAGTVRSAREQIARETGVPIGTLENLRRGNRIKQVSAWVRDRLEAAIRKEITREIKALEHELATIESGARRVSPGTMEEVSEGIARLKAVLNEAAE